MKTKSYGKLQKVYRNDFSGGWNAYLGVRQIKDNESPEMTNCDFMGKGGVGNREGYAEIGTPATYTSGIKGMGALHTASYHQLLSFKSDGANVVLSHSTDGGAWTNVAGNFTNTNIDGVQAAGNFYTGNGTDAMKHWDGAAWNTTTNGTIGYYPAYYNQRIWVVDETDKDRLNFSGQYSEQKLTGGGLVNKLGDFSDATAGWISFRYGSGAEITGLKVFKNALYVFLRDSIYSIVPATTADTFTITLITNAVGCVSHRSIAQVGEDLFFASDDGVYSLGDVANFTGGARTTNKSAKIQGVFDNLTAARKSDLCAEYFNFKYHLFYSLYGTTNDSCIAYDVRYGGWVDWRNMAATDAVLYIDSTNAEYLMFGTPTTSQVFKMYSGTTDDGAGIQSTFYTKSFDEENPDISKVYFDHTFIFGALNGTVTVSVIWDDSESAASESISQTRPQGGFGRDAFGRMPFGDATNTTTTITNYSGRPIRIRVSSKKFAVQYRITSTGSWRIDTISTTFKPLSHYSFPSANRVTAVTDTTYDSNETYD